ncbi:polysaccharide biosynthesis protein [Weeksellaceae bacterium TAE3-ERU29]|nr:polysaccharide biosynthesis protein [Weeksellaceae bacterium TAE3-ERU29]
MKEAKLKATNYLIKIAKNFSNISLLPRWVVFSMDLAITVSSIFITYFLMQVWGLSNLGSIENNRISFFLILGISVLFFFIFKVSSGVLRHSSIRDIAKISLSTFGIFITLLLINIIWKFETGKSIIHNPTLVFYCLILFLSLSLFRFYVKLAFVLFNRIRDEKIRKKVLIFGTNSDAVGLGSAIIENSNSKFNLVGFISNKNSQQRGRILGCRLYSFDQIDILKQKIDINGIIFSDSEIKKEENQEFIENLIKKNIVIYHLPIKLIEEKSPSQNISPEIKSLQIEDLLYRDEIKIENEEISKRHLGKVVLVTGGAGSIGSEIVRKVSLFKPSKIIVIDQAETPLNDIKLEMEAKHPEIEYIFHLASVGNKYRIEPLFKKYPISMVYHAAAYKHVPIVEDNPIEAINVNIIGTRILANLSSKYKVNRFVMISTDKAVNPTNVMGASKRIAELYVQSLQNKPDNVTKFITTRFGNVLGSNGSVIPLFRKQIEKGGPVTVTDKNITRYFMTIPEACELVLQAGTMGQGGEIFVFDMGKPVKILDLAKKMIQLSGFTPEIDIPIKITGLRPGEKLYEELLSDKTKTLPTHHNKIMRAKDTPLPYEYMENEVKILARGSLKKSSLELVKIIKNIVPEYISNNSDFEVLDNYNN